MPSRSRNEGRTEENEVRRQFSETGLRAIHARSPVFTPISNVELPWAKLSGRCPLRVASHFPGTRVQLS